MCTPMEQYAISFEAECPHCGKGTFLILWPSWLFGERATTVEELLPHLGVEL